MRILFLTIPIAIFLCSGCATPDKLSKGDMQGISSLSIAISTTITNDVSAYSRKKHYVVTNDSDKKRNLDELEKKRGPYYSDRLTVEQLAMLFKDFEDHDDIPRLGTMGFQGDATLMMQVQGRKLWWLSGTRGYR